MKVFERGDGGAGEIVGAELRAVHHRRPMMLEGNAEIAELEQRRHERCVGFRCSLFQRPCARPRSTWAASEN